MFECVVSGCRQRAMVAVCRLKSRLKDLEWCVTYTDVCAMRGDQVTAWHSPCGICFVMVSQVHCSLRSSSSLQSD